MIRSLWMDRGTTFEWSPRLLLSDLLNFNHIWNLLASNTTQVCMFLDGDTWNWLQMIALILSDICGLLTVVSRSEKLFCYLCHLICCCLPFSSVRLHFIHFSSSFPLSVGILCDMTQVRVTVWVWAKEQPKQGNCSATTTDSCSECFDISSIRRNLVLSGFLFFSFCFFSLQAIHHIYTPSMRALS